MINNEKIENVNKIKYLGIQIHSKLKFNDHLEYTISKIAMKRTCSLQSTQYRKMIYISIVEPHFIYCSSICFTLTDAQIEKLQKMQNKVLRFILKKPYRTPIKEMLDTLNWLSVKQNIFYLNMKFINNMKHDRLPKYLSSLLKFNHYVHSASTRNKKIITEADKNNLFYKGLKYYNEL